MTAAKLPLAQSAMGQPGTPEYNAADGISYVTPGTRPQHASAIVSAAVAARRSTACKNSGCKLEVKDASQDIAEGDAEKGEGHRKQRQGERVTAAVAAVRGAGRGGRPRTAAPGRSGEQGLGLHQVPQPAEPREPP